MDNSSLPEKAIPRFVSVDASSGIAKAGGPGIGFRCVFLMLDTEDTTFTVPKSSNAGAKGVPLDKSEGVVKRQFFAAMPFSTA